MVSLYYLKPSTILSQVSPQDTIIKYTKEERAKLSGLPTARELRQTREIAEARFRLEVEEAEQLGMASEEVFSAMRPFKFD